MSLCGEGSESCCGDEGEYVEKLAHQGRFQSSGVKTQ
jgi:hypothetical protein